MDFWAQKSTPECMRGNTEVSNGAHARHISKHFWRSASRPNSEATNGCHAERPTGPAPEAVHLSLPVRDATAAYGCDGLRPLSQSAQLRELVNFHPRCPVVRESPEFQIDRLTGLLTPAMMRQS
jgi:hypothetical protein